MNQKSNQESPRLVHRSMHRAWISIVTSSLTLVACLAFMFMVGCDSSETPVTKKSTPSSTEKAETPVVDRKAELRDKLVGIWLGAAYLDENLLNEKLNGLPQEEASAIIQQAQFFAGTEMAIEFRPNGSLENDVEITAPDGQTIREGGQGTWKIVQVDGESFVVEIAERQGDGSMTSSQKVYKFYEDGDHFAVSIPLDNILGQCNPLLIFERKILSDQVAEVPAQSESR